MEGSNWTFLTNHAAVFLAIAREPEARVRDIAARIGITERAVMRIIKDLSTEGYIHVTRVGRRNSYRIEPAQPMRRPLWRSHQVSELLDLLPDA